ncbi:MAG: DNA gyrase inhibitor YacG [Myxococcales bacterium]|nr:DNA gyrase inhibitor YacG [Myxococcales bacterium]
MSDRLIHCPICGRLSRWEDEPRGPFCSERCRLIDLGNWAGENYRLSADDGEDSTAVSADRKQED